jgi:hypothetical protein
MASNSLIGRLPGHLSLRLLKFPLSLVVRCKMGSYSRLNSPIVGPCFVHYDSATAIHWPMSPPTRYRSLRGRHRGQLMLTVVMYLYDPPHRFEKCCVCSLSQPVGAFPRMCLSRLHLSDFLISASFTSSCTCCTPPIAIHCGAYPFIRCVFCHSLIRRR